MPHGIIMSAMKPDLPSPFRQSSRRQVLAVAIVALAAAGCHEPPKLFVEQFDDGDTLPILKQIRGAHCSEYTHMKVVIRDPATFVKLPIVDIPVDFAREMLLLVTLGEVASDQYEIRIERVWREGNRIRVDVKVSPPPPDAPLVQAAPFCVAVVPRSNLNVADFATDPPQRRRTR